ncbi:uncharacterized protein STEHIDRAFT_149071 [Stereum hirsutum FP-91666 SS1]|uniref:uncharacterized protein n=1 Tax=Stereum hirsutum (strain FP-91666) TaxID=721885 RepID=UPI0004449B2F|nr:uncharacterized protein STEHIDRAFT_149071 [Stereum hirsutum FP-91666 SS1]EIM83595.1 hypothetical protein STEHIDRAFT_149071 [Stereum hirsutum FP-91666 SS1]
MTTMSSSSSRPFDQPPVPFDNFEFTFDPSLSALFPSPAPLPSSAGLFSASEETDILGFLDNFNWEFDSNALPPGQLDSAPPAPLPYPFHTNSLPNGHEPPHPSSLFATEGSMSHLHMNGDASRPSSSRTRSSPTSPVEPSTPKTNGRTGTSNGKAKAKTGPKAPLLSTPQKRLNHIMSEQKRRNAIREGYAQLTTLLAPAGAPPGTGMPTRGRPKGSGSRSKGNTKGKSGVLFRAVEYCHWLEDGIEALRAEVLRVEAAAGIHGIP